MALRTARPFDRPWATMTTPLTPSNGAPPTSKGSVRLATRRKAGLDSKVEGVEVTNIVEDLRDFKMIFDPSHPDADKFGYVLMPNINTIEEMVDMLTAKRSYEANVTAISAAKNMALKSLEILK